MDDKSFTIRVPRRWARVAMIVGVAALIVAPLTAVASHVFNDVPDSHTFHDNITWLADADVTRGCNPPDNTEFCPDDNVTRGQMAAFMQRFAQYIDAEDGTPGQADNAQVLDGQPATFYERPLAMATGSAFTGTEASIQQGEIARLSLGAPANGSVIVEHTSTFADSDAVVAVWAEPYNPGAVCDSYTDGTAMIGTVAGVTTTGLTTAATGAGAGHHAVTEGDHTYSLCLDTVSGTSNNIDWAIKTSWYPEGSASTATASQGQSSPAPSGGFANP